MSKLSPPPRKDDPRFDDWVRVDLYNRLSDLDAPATAFPLSASQVSALTSGDDTTLHYHAADRKRANHTGTQPAATISDFEAAVRAIVGSATDHALLLNNAWTSSGHTGTASRLAYFDSSGLAAELSVGNGVEVSGTGVRRSALTGDVTAAAGSNATTIANDAVTDAKLRDSGACSVIGRPANSSGDPADISAAANDRLLIRTSNALSFGQLTVGMFPDDVVTYAKIQNVSATDRLLGRSTSGAGDIEEITCTSAARSILDDTSTGAIRTTLGVGTGDSPAFTAISVNHVQFPATQVDAADANALDDYEEGTWTPSLGGTTTYTTQTGAYTKIGHLVSIQGQIVVNAIGSGSASTMTGLPFTVGTSATCGSATFINSVTNWTYLACRVSTAGTQLILIAIGAAGASMTATANTFQNGTNVLFNITYVA